MDKLSHLLWKIILFDRPRKKVVKLKRIIKGYSQNELNEFAKYLNINSEIVKEFNEYKKTKTKTG